MAYDTFKIKYLFEIYPDTDFEQEFVTCQEVVELPPEPQVIATDEDYGHILFTDKSKRHIQSRRFRKYEVKILLSRNIDWYLLDYAAYTTLTTQASETFAIYNVQIEQNKVPGTRQYVINISFYRDDSEIVNHLSSDNVLSYKTDESASVNEIQYDVDNPAYSFNNVAVYTYDAGGATVAGFKVPLNDLTNTILVNDTYYMHTDDEAFNEEQDVLGEYLNFGKCISKDASFVYFNCSNDEVNPAFTWTIPNMILDHAPDYRDIPSGETVSDKTISLVIYTFIEPKYGHETETIEGITAPDGVEENQKTIEKDIVTFKVWLKESEKYLAEYLNYALAEDIEISLANYTNILPSQTKDIITIKENSNLIDLFEYDVKIIYNVKAVNINR